jgi:hypothetical protein
MQFTPATLYAPEKSFSMAFRGIAVSAQRLHYKHNFCIG